MPESTKPPSQAGLKCRKCGRSSFRVIYTRARRDGKIVRRRECRACGARATTWERMIGG
jgi:transcriptional regulator NrdR family protein